MMEIFMRSEDGGHSGGKLVIGWGLFFVLLVGVLAFGFGRSPLDVSGQTLLSKIGDYYGELTGDSSLVGEVDVDINTLRARLPAQFRDHETSHFIILSDADAATVRHLAGTLEKTHSQFVRSCRRMNITTTALTRKFTCTLFAKRDEFQAYALKYDQVSANWVGGYYANAGNYEVFYAAGQDPGSAQAEQQFQSWENELNNTEKSIAKAQRVGDRSRATQLSQYATQLSAHIKNERKRLNTYSKGQSEARTIHETIHLLAFNMGLQSRLRNAPFWFSEGLATNFETDNSNSAFGPDFDDPIRQSAFRKYLKTNHLLTVRSLIQVTDAAHADREEADILYQESYEFFHWLFRFHRKGLANLFRRYAQSPDEAGALPAGELTPSDHLREFESIVGNPESIQKDWLRWERNQK